ncbi:hypothetical protein BASA83_011714 [Batrachochytrium salamandrivorans]|nr:hypothetical protein BASA83_011714 [Batrachochytrium salamandrivorans]
MGLKLVGGNKSHLAPLQTTINKGIRLFTGARLSTAIGPLLVETGIGSLLTRSLVSRVRLLERSVTKRTPINAICFGKPSPSTGIRPENIREPKAALPDKFDGTRRHFRGFINQLELVFQLQDKRYDTDRKKIATLGTLLTDKALSWYNPYIEQPERRYRLERCALRSQFYSGLSSEIKDHLVHCESPVSRLLLWTKQFGSDNRILNGNRSSSTTLDHSDETRPQLKPVSRTYPQQYQQQQYVYNSNHQQIQQPSAPTTATTPVQPRLTSNDMDNRFCTSWSLSLLLERQQRFSQGLCLVCGQSGHLKATCPRSNLSL